MNGTKSAGGIRWQRNALPAEMLPHNSFSMACNSSLVRRKAELRNALMAKGETIRLPAGTYNRVYVLAASADGDQKATFEVAR